MVYVLAYHLNFSVFKFGRQIKVWSSEEKCPQHSFFIGKKSKNQLQKPAAQTTVQTQNMV